VLNNLGFCLIPTDPRRAIVELKKSLDLSPSGRLSFITVCNIAMTYYFLGDLESAAEWLRKTRVMTPEWEAWLWTLSDDHGMSLEYFTDVGQYAEQLRDSVLRNMSGGTST
jgi:hypothetical protein